MLHALCRYDTVRYTCSLTNKQAMEANKKFKSNQETSSFRYLPLERGNQEIASYCDETTRAWENRYSEKRAIARYPYDWIVGNILSRRTISQKASPRVLDFGFGGGNHFWFLEHEGFEAWGLDISDSAKSLAIETCDSMNVSINSDRLLVGGLEILKALPDGFFDFIIDRESLVQLSFDNACIYTSNFHRILSPNGFYIGSLFSDLHPSTESGKYHGSGYYSNFSDGLFSDMGGRQFYNLSLLKELFSGFTLEEVSLSDYRTYVGRANHSSEYHVVARK